MKLISDDDLKDILINPKQTRSGQYVSDCPICGKEHHFYISRKTQMWDCKKCHECGNVYKLLKILDKRYLLAGSTIVDKDKIDSIRNINQKIINNVEVSELPVRHMPAGWKVSIESTDYLISRGITAEDCKRYNIGSTDLLRRYKDYVLIPIYDNGKIRGFIGRYGSKIVPENKLRYNNSIGTEFSELLFGYDEILNGFTSTVILVEGIFDKISVDKALDLWRDNEIKCVCTFGKKISEKQINKLLLKGVTNVILLYDFDAIKEIKRYGLELEKYFITGITYTNKKDIDECSTREAQEVFTRVMKPMEFIEGVIGKLK